MGIRDSHVSGGDQLAREQVKNTFSQEILGR